MKLYVQFSRIYCWIIHQQKKLYREHIIKQHNNNNNIQIPHSTCLRKLPYSTKLPHSTCLRKLPHSTCLRKLPHSTCIRKLPHSTKIRINKIFMHPQDVFQPFNFFLQLFPFTNNPFQPSKQNMITFFIQSYFPLQNHQSCNEK